MGITQNSVDRLRRHNLLQPMKMLELGAQNMYDNDHYGSIAKAYFEQIGIEHTSWDIIPHQGAIQVDLREDLPIVHQYDIITDFGTSEHVDGNYYQVHKNIHNLCKVGGFIVHKNPKTGHWPGHGCNYVNMNFYITLGQLCGYECIELTEHFAMGNTIDGCNICVVMRKMYDAPFITKEQFETIAVYKS